MKPDPYLEGILKRVSEEDPGDSDRTPPAIYVTDTGHAWKTEGDVPKNATPYWSADDVDWLERGLSEWRSLAAVAERRAEQNVAKFTIALGYLKVLVNEGRTSFGRETTEASAKLWLQSIGEAP